MGIVKPVVVGIDGRAPRPVRWLASLEAVVVALAEAAPDWRVRILRAEATAADADPGLSATLHPSISPMWPEVPLAVQQALWASPQVPRERLVESAAIWLTTLGTPPLPVTGLPTVVMVPDLDWLRLPHLYPEAERVALVQRMTELLTSGAACLVCSRLAGRELHHYFQLPPARIIQVPHPAPPRRALPDHETDGLLRLMLWLPSETARTGATMTVAVVREALARLPASAFAGWEVVVGVADSSPPCAIAPGCRIVHAPTVESRWNLFRQAAILIYLPLSEDVGWPVLEAWVAGCAVVTVDHPALLEQIGAGACCLDPFVVEVLTERIEQLLTDRAARLALVEAGQSALAARRSASAGAQLRAALAAWMA